MIPPCIVSRHILHGGESDSFENGVVVLVVSLSAAASELGFVVLVGCVVDEETVFSLLLLEVEGQVDWEFSVGDSVFFLLVLSG